MRHVTGAQRVEIRLLGGFALLRDGMEVPARAFGRRKVTLIKGTGIKPPGSSSALMLAAALWPDRSPADPVANLQVPVNQASIARRPCPIITGQHGCTLAPEPACAVDASSCSRAATAGAGSPTALRATELRAALDCGRETRCRGCVLRRLGRVPRPRVPWPWHLLKRLPRSPVLRRCRRAVEMSPVGRRCRSAGEPAVLLLVGHWPSPATGRARCAFGTTGAAGRRTRCRSVSRPLNCIAG